MSYIFEFCSANNNLCNTLKYSKPLFAKEILSKPKLWDDLYINRCFIEFNKVFLKNTGLSYIITLNTKIPYSMLEYTQYGLKDLLSSIGFKNTIIETHSYNDDYCKIQVLFTINTI